MLVDAQELLAAGALDVQCEADLFVAGENVLGLELDYDETTLVLTSSLPILDQDPSDFIRIMDEALAKLSTALQQASTRKLV